jgi:hypothetical protein
MAANYLVLRDLPDPHIELVWRSFLTNVDMPSHYCTPKFLGEPFWSFGALGSRLHMAPRPHSASGKLHRSASWFPNSSYDTV